jgi:alkanesulfonate monooxygenase SsuD/methylene tetrahydromethanopterin reductase-like flavin-dependent oxidoreductase (luciferase family)
VPIVVPTEREAEAKDESLENAIDVESTLALLSGVLDMDLSELDPDREWTVREVAGVSGRGSTSPIVVGTPEQVVDELQYYHEEVGVHGFNVKQAVRTASLDDFVDLVVPELRGRDLFRTEYEGDSLRERLYGEGQARLPEQHPARERTGPTADRTASNRFK